MIDEKILEVLRPKADEYVSGEELSKRAGVSRAAIWKHIEKLRREGYDIEAVPHLGYKLLRAPDSLIPAEIKWKLNTKIIGREVITYKKIPSTNVTAYELAEKGLEEGLVVLAEEQTEGKGRLGRTWSSPADSGIYMSCVLRPKISPNEIPRITLLAAVAVAKAVRESNGLPAAIKWPNDILINGRKVCGILTEMKAEQDEVRFVVLGIGVNVNTSAKDLPKGASSLKAEKSDGRPLSRVELAKKILEKLDEYYAIMNSKGFSSIIDEWKHLSSMIGARVKVNLPNRIIEGQAHDIDTDGALLVRLESGMIERVSSGDVVMVR